MNRINSMGFGKFFFLIMAGMIMLPVLCPAWGTSGSGTKTASKEREDHGMSNGKELENLIAQGDWEAVEKTRQMGEAAWPSIRLGAVMPDFQSRQVAMACAGLLGGEEAGKILLAGLNDKHINVSLAAAGQLSMNPPPSALHGIINKLAADSEDNIRGLLALALGRLPDEASIRTLLGLAQGEGDVAQNARLALAKLKQPKFLEACTAGLMSEAPHIRYETLAQLIYIDNPDLAARAENLLSDKAEAVNIGNQYKPMYRRVCDQAVDTLAALLKITPPFEIGPALIYSDEQLYQMQLLIK